MNYNKTILAGNLTADPELRHTASGKVCCNFTLASSRKYSDGNGGVRVDTLFLEVSCWGHVAENVTKYKSKGDCVLAEGMLQTDSWEDKATGQKRSKIKMVAQTITFVPSGKQNNESNEDREASSPRITKAGGPVSDRDDREMPDGDDIPF